ncbi:MAG: hypothetical protein IJW17_09805 [Lentisphaeria bacterium]|nr:hypothetical protein [Lentisphaeria bacterium]
MKNYFTCVVLLLLSVFTLQAAEEVLFPSAKSLRLQKAVIDQGVIRINSDGTKNRSLAGIWMKLKKGEKVTFKAEVKGENIGKKKHYFQGVRLVVFGRFNGKADEIATRNNLSGTFDWTELTLTLEVKEKVDIWLNVELREVPGTLYVRKITMEKSLAVQKEKTEKPLAMRRAEQIDLGFLCLAKRNPEKFEYVQMFQAWKKLRPLLAKMKPEEAAAELDGFEAFQLSLHRSYSGNSLSPNFYQWMRERRIKFFYEELTARTVDWRSNAAALEKFNLYTSVEQEIAGMLKYKEKYPESKNVFSPQFEAAAAFFKEIAEERVRLGAELLAQDNEAEYLETIARQREMPHVLAAWKGHWKNLRARWAAAYNAGFFLLCSDLEKRAALQKKKILAPLFADNGKPVFRPGSSTYATGVYGFLGTWHTLLNTNIRNTTLYARPAEEFRPYAGSLDEWNVSVEISDAVPVGFSQLEGSWTHSHRRYRFRDLKTNRECFADSWWSGLAPGVLFEFPVSSITVSDNTLKRPAVPSMIVAEIGGKAKIFRKPTEVPLGQMSAKWMLLHWENTAPKRAILLVFQNLPEQLKTTAAGLQITAKGKIGKVAVATLHGAVPQKIDYAKNWKSVPAGELEKIRLVSKLLSYFPLEMEETFSVGKDKITIYNRVKQAIRLDASAPAYVPFPPLYSQALAGKTPLTVISKLSPAAMITKFGPFRTTAGNELVYQITKPDLLDRIPLKPSGEEAFLKEYNQFISQRSKNDEWRGTHMGDQSSGVLTGYLMMEPETRKLLDVYRSPGQLDRVARGEAFYYRTRARTSYMLPIYLIDPMTGRSGWFAGWRGERHGFPMKGDMTMFNMALLQFPYTEAKFYGRWDLVERNWERLKDFCTPLMLCQTWRAPGMNCTNSGLILAGDMFGDGYRAYIFMYRLALGMKDRALADHALYLAAKQTVTATALIHRNISVLSAHVRNTGGPEKANGQIGWSICVDNNGTSAAPWKPFKPNAWNAFFQVAGCTAYDYPFFGMLLRFLPEETEHIIQEMLTEIPETLDPAYCIRGERRNNAFNTLKFMAFTQRDVNKIRKLYRKNFSADYSPQKPPAGVPADVWKKSWGPFEFTDWPTRVGTLPHLIAQNDPLWIGDYGRMRLLTGRFDRDSCTAEIGLAAENDDVLTVVSMLEPLSVTVNGKPVAVRKGSWGMDYEIPVKAGAAVVTIRLPHGDPAAYPFPSREKPTPLINLAKAPAPGVKPEMKTAQVVYKTGVCRTLDLAKFCNQALNDQLPSDKNQDVWNFPKGMVQISGVPFRFADPAENGGKGMIMLRGKARQSYPASVKIPVGEQNVRRIFFLHGICYASGVKVMTYRLHFSDGQTRDLEIFRDIHVGEWKIPPAGSSLGYVRNASPGPICGPAKAGQWGKGVGSYLYVWENDVVAKGVTMQGVNQRGMAKLKAIEIISENSSVPIILAVTLEE